MSNTKLGRAVTYSYKGDYAKVKLASFGLLSGIIGEGPRTGLRFALTDSAMERDEIGHY